MASSAGGITTARRFDCHIYEVHLGSYRRNLAQNGRYLSYRELAEQLVPYVAEMGFTHIEIMPIMEYPFDGSWGYQPIALFAPTSRYGAPDDFRALVEACHKAGLSVLLDWVPGHFPNDPHGLGRFDGTALYEHADPRQGFHRDWNTLIYNLGRREVANFLLSSALYWLHEFHIDGIRVDAVASMLYLDYSRPPGEWIPNAFGGRENLAAIAFLRRMNELIFESEASGATSVMPRNRLRGRWYRARPMSVDWASATNGTSAGCTTPCTIWRPTRSTWKFPPQRSHLRLALRLSRELCIGAQS